MDRLTKRDRKGQAYFDNDGALIRGANGTFHQKKDMTGKYIHDRFVALDKAIDRLAAYEDTGLEPEEITRGKPYCVFYCNRQCNLNGDFCAEGPGCPFEMDGARARRFLLQIPSHNAPLTLEELREMDGEPVYLDFSGCGEWTLVRVLQNSEDNILLVHKNGIYAPAKFVFECGGHIYRHKPEEGTK